MADTNETSSYRDLPAAEPTPAVDVQALVAQAQAAAAGWPPPPAPPTQPEPAPPPAPVVMDTYEAEPVQAEPHYLLPGQYASFEAMVQQNYDILGLHKERQFVKGELTQVDYWLKKNPVTGAFSGLAVRETIDYYRYEDLGLPQGGDLVYFRTKRIQWMLSDGTAGHETTTVKYYTPKEGLAEGVTRRQNVYENAKLTAFGMLGQENATDMLGALAPHLTLYVEGKKTPLLLALRDLQRPYLTIEIKRQLIEVLRIEDAFAI